MSEPIVMKLRWKYINVPTPKFSGKKRKVSSEGRTGRVHRRTKRCLVPGCHNSRKRR